MKKKIVATMIIIFLLSVVYPVILSYILANSDGWDGKKSSSQEVNKEVGKI